MRLPLREAAFEDLLSELEAVTTEMLRADPHELTVFATLMERRQEAATAVASRLNTAAPQPGAIERTRHIWEQGAELEERLRLVRASARRELQELYRTGFCVRAMAAQGGAGHSSGLNIEA